MERHDVFVATFNPKRIDDLKPGSEEWIGRRLPWSAAWMIEPEDGGSYVGEHACAPHVMEGDMPPFAWVPERDLDDIRYV